MIRYTQRDLEHYAHEWRMGVNHPATFVPQVLYEQYGLFDTAIKLQADADFINRLYYNGVKFLFVDKILSNQSDGGTSQSNYKQSLKDYKYLLDKSEPRGWRKKFLYFKNAWILKTKRLLPAFVVRMYRG